MIPGLDEPETVEAVTVPPKIYRNRRALVDELAHRKLVLRMHADGLIPAEIARRLGRDVSSIRELLAKYDTTPTRAQRSAAHREFIRTHPHLRVVDLARKLNLSPNWVTQLRKQG